LTDPLDEVFGDGLTDALSQVADPDLALLGLVRLMESLRLNDIDGDDPGGELIAALRHAGRGRDRLLAVLGASSALGDHLVTHPGHWRFVTEASRQSAAERHDSLVTAVTGAFTTADPTPAYDALRVAYRLNLLGIAALDLTAEKAVDELPPTAAALADLASAALEAALVIARAEVGEAADTCRFAVIGMGKCGGRELNYVSDVDVIFVAEPVSDSAADEAAAQIGQVVEGLTTAPVLRDLSRRLGIELPITEGVCRVLDGEDLNELAASLMGRQPTRE